MKICFISFYWQWGGEEMEGRRETGNKEEKTQELFQVWLLAGADIQSYYFPEI